MRLLVYMYLLEAFEGGGAFFTRALDVFAIDQVAHPHALALAPVSPTHMLDHAGAVGHLGLEACFEVLTRSVECRVCQPGLESCVCNLHTRAARIHLLVHPW